MDAIMNKTFRNGKALWGFVNTLKAQQMLGFLSFGRLVTVKGVAEMPIELIHNKVIWVCGLKTKRTQDGIREGFQV